MDQHWFCLLAGRARHGSRNDSVHSEFGARMSLFENARCVVEAFLHHVLTKQKFLRLIFSLSVKKIWKNAIVLEECDRQKVSKKKKNTHSGRDVSKMNYAPVPCLKQGSAVFAGSMLCDSRGHAHGVIWTAHLLRDTSPCARISYFCCRQSWSAPLRIHVRVAVDFSPWKTLSLIFTSFLGLW